MTVSQENAMRCGMIPEQNPPEFFAKHLSPYAFIRPRVENKALIEVGFGDGYGMDYLSSAAREIIGVDIAPANIPLATAKYRAKNLKFVRFDGVHFPFKDGIFDAALSFQVIEHIPEAQLVGWLSEISRILKPDGFLCVSTLNLSRAMKPGNPYEKNIDHEKEFTAAELEDLLKTVFPDVRMYGLHYTPKHRFYRRLKKWGLAPSLKFVSRYFSRVTTHDFLVNQANIAGAVDLIAVCQKSGFAARGA